MLTSSTQLHNRSFHVVERTRTSSKCQKLKNARAKRAKVLFSIVKYANLWGFCCRRRRGCLRSLIIINDRNQRLLKNRHKMDHNPSISQVQTCNITTLRHRQNMKIEKFMSLSLSLWSSCVIMFRCSQWWLTFFAISLAFILPDIFQVNFFKLLFYFTSHEKVKIRNFSSFFSFSPLLSK